MYKKISIIVISILLLVPALIPVFSFFYADDTRVCGADNINYPNLSYAEKNGIEIQYDFPCESPHVENGLYERSEELEFAGMLLDFSESENMTQFYIRNNFDKKDYLVLDNRRDRLPIEIFLPGDQLKIHGTINKNTGVVHADLLEDLSVKELTTENCLIENIDHNIGKIFCRDDASDIELFVDEDSRIVAGLKNNSSLADLREGDELRVRFDDDYRIKMLIVYERGDIRYLRNNIFSGKAILLSTGDDADGKTFEIELLGLKDSKVFKVKITDNTRLVKKYFGNLKADGFNRNDDLYIVGRLKDSGTHEALLIKNNSVWK